MAPQPSPAVLGVGQRRAFCTALLRWFDQSRRDLPWRADHDPYRVWISEIMLQQTRVAAVLEHYRRFLARFPDVQHLARARESSVLAAWSGLGYYRRARLMHAAARQIVREREGRFPQNAAGWRELPGIGRYTAAAIASICFGEACAVVDGNVERVLHRLFGATAAECWAVAGSLLSPDRPGDFNQAMMELGATVCLPKGPLCASCPMARWCGTRRGERIPAKGPARAARLRAALHYGLITRGNSVLLVQRAAGESLMPGMWELPALRAEQAAGMETITVRHAILNTDYVAHVAVIRDKCGAVSLEGRWFSPQRASGLALTGLARKVLRRVGIIQK